ncbi:MAG TPA: hypothetical protein DCY07_05210 [Rhodospirillaceae bacterium]|nr:hypothetical protein [Rhodospirillaceae bacterium]
MSHATRQPAPRRRAFTLTEAAIVLGITGIVLAAIWGAVNATTRNKNINQAVTNMALVVQNMRTLYRSQSGFANLNVDITPAMVTAGIFPSSMLTDATPPTPISPWGTAVTIRSVTATTFYVVFNSTLPTDDCIGLVSRAIGPGRDRGLSGIVTSANNFNAAALTTLEPAGIAPCTWVTFIYNIKG